MNIKEIEYKVDERGCWNCTSHVPHAKEGYPRMMRDKKYEFIFHHMYRKHRGEIEPGLIVCHTCDNRVCINPDHLFIGTHKDNSDDMWAKGRGVPNPAKPGQDHPNAKLDEAQARHIKFSNEKPAALSQQYGVRLEQIYKIRRGASWPHLV